MVVNVMNRASQENVDPALQAEADDKGAEQQMQRRDLTVDDEQEIWRDVTLTQYKHTQTHSFTPYSLSDCRMCLNVTRFVS